MADMPGLSYGRIAGRLLAIVADGDDAGENPDAVGMTGIVTFTPQVKDPIRVAGANPKAIIIPTPISCELDADGDIRAPGSLTSEGVYLVATDVNNPSGWTYRVSFQVKYQGIDIAVPSFNITVPAGSDRDLADLAPFTDPSTGVAIIRGERGYNGDMGEATDLGNRSGALDLSLFGRSGVVRMTLTGNITSLVLPTPASGNTMTLTLVVKQDATGGRTIAWPAALLRSDGLTPPISSAAGKRDMFHLIWDGADWWLSLGAGRA